MTRFICNFAARYSIVALKHKIMEKLGAYEIDLKGMAEDTCSYEYVLDDHFFESIEALDIKKGKVDVSLSVRKTAGIYELSFTMEGTVTISCDRCLDDMEQPISSEQVMKVKLGDEFAEEDDMIVVPENEGVIDVAWYMYEYVVLAIPMKHVHAEGECNKAMESKLSQYLCAQADDSDEESTASREIDPRWNELKKIIDNN